MTLGKGSARQGKADRAVGSVSDTGLGGRKPIRARLSLRRLALLSAVPLLAVALILFLQGRSAWTNVTSMLKQEHDAILDTRLYLEDYINASAARSAQFIAGLEGLGAFVQGQGEADREALERELVSFARSRSDCASISLFDAARKAMMQVRCTEGRVAALEREALWQVVVSEPMQAGFALDRGSVLVSGLSFDAVDRDLPVIEAGAGVYDAAGGLVALVVIDTNMSLPVSDYSSLGGAVDTALLIADEAGYFVNVAAEALPGPNETAQHLEELVPGLVAAIAQSGARDQLMLPAGLVTFRKVPRLSYVTWSRGGLGSVLSFTGEDVPNDRVLITFTPAAVLDKLRGPILRNEALTGAILAPVMIVLAILLEQLMFYRREGEMAEREMRVLKQSEAFALSIIENSPLAIIVSDPEGTIRLANAVACQTFGYAREELVGQQIELLLPEDFKGEHVILRRSFQGRDGEVRRMAGDRGVWGLRADGTRMRLEVGLGQFSALGRRSVVATITNITERFEAEELQAQTFADLERSNSELEQFAYIASHDLQEPLRTVGGMLQLVQARYSDKLDARGQEFIELAVDGAKRMGNLISDLLSFSQVGRGDVSSEPVDMGLLVGEVREALSAAIEDAGAVITVGDLPVVQGNPTLLFQLMQNLLGNAIKFRVPGRTPVIEITARPLDDSTTGAARRAWEFRVADNGIGVPEKFTGEVFKVFRRLHTHDAYAGTGVGLAICRRIVECHDGSISLESDQQPDQSGTTIVFTLRDQETIAKKGGTE